MLLNSDVGAPLVVLEVGSLFAHAPSSLHFGLHEAVTSIRVGFGIREGAQGLHGRLCFAVRRESDNAELLQRCIDAGATVDAMHVEQVIQQPLEAGEELLFDIRCEDTCDYAWTYWSQLSLEVPSQ